METQEPRKEPEEREGLPPVFIIIIVTLSALCLRLCQNLFH